MASFGSGSPAAALARGIPCGYSTLTGPMPASTRIVRLGERVGAFVVPAGAEPALSELTTFLQERFRLAKQKLPEVLRVLPELPMTATGKVNKQELRAQVRQAQNVAH